MISLFSSGQFTAGDLRLEGEPAHHAHVRRAKSGDPVRVLDGRGHIGTGVIMSLGKSVLDVDVQSVTQVPPATPLEVIVPVADRDRMLLAAEKCVELQITAWRPAYFARSRSVSPRGEGEKFREKLRARMQGALEQSGAAWLPDIHDEIEVTDAWTQVPREWRRLVLDRDGPPLISTPHDGAVAMSVGPEGGMEPHELDAARQLGWLTASVGATILRFETAIIAGVAVIRASQLQRRSD